MRYTPLPAARFAVFFRLMDSITPPIELTLTHTRVHSLDRPMCLLALP